VITRAAAFNTRCNLSVTVLGAPARTVLHCLYLQYTQLNIIDHHHHHHHVETLYQNENSLEQILLLLHDRHYR